MLWDLVWVAHNCLRFAAVKANMGDKLLAQLNDLKVTKESLEQARKQTIEERERKREVVQRELFLARELRKANAD